MDTGPGRHGQSPDVRRATSQAKRFKSKGSSSRTSTVDSNRYGGVKVRVTLTVLVRNGRLISCANFFAIGADGTRVLVQPL